MAESNVLVVTGVCDSVELEDDEKFFMNRLFLPSFQRLALSQCRLEVPVPLRPRDEIWGSALNRFTCRFSSLARLKVPEYYLLLAEALRAASIIFGLMFRDWQSKLASRRKAPELYAVFRAGAGLRSLSCRYRVVGARNFHLIRFRVL
jgi:hypothetical protein